MDLSAREIWEVTSYWESVLLHLCHFRIIGELFPSNLHVHESCLQANWKVAFFHWRRTVSIPRVEAPINNYLIDVTPNLEKYKVVQFFPL